MFANSINSTPAGTVRTRRRPRPSSQENSIAQPKAKRQRNTLNEQTFVPPEDVPEMQQVPPEAAIATLQNQNPADLLSHMQDLTVRTKKRRIPSERTAKGDGSTTLTSNEIYTVSRLPALPDRLRSDSSSRQHGAVYSDSGYALSLSHTHAIVWPYSDSSTAPETFTFTLPQASKHTSDALPLGTLVSASASENEPGLAIVMPTTGKICYWESISSAATLDLIRKKQNGLEGSVPGMMSGETVIQILNAETAGFVLGFSSGRLAYMSVRDGQGRPAINVQFLQTGSGPRGGLFGSVRNLLAGSWGGDIAAIRAGPSTKIGERKVVMATSKGKIQAWELHRGGHNTSRADLDLRDDLVAALKESNAEMQDLLPESFEILDVTFSPQPPRLQSIDGDAEGEGLELFLLTSMTSRTRSFYSIIEITLGPVLCKLDRIIPISSYTTPLKRTAIAKPRIYLPSPALAAFLVFDRSVVVVSMARQQDTPEMQRVGADFVPSQSTFEDVVDFRDDLGLEIVGSGEEEPYGHLHAEDHKSLKHRAKAPAAVLLLKGGGLIRIAVTNTNNMITSKTGRLSAKSKLAQAVFFRTLDNNPLSFMGRCEQKFEAGELDMAALTLSEGIINSDTIHLSKVSAALDQHLGKRASALRSLADHLKEMKVALDRSTRWKLIYDAEKLHGATLMWKTYERAMKEKPAGQKEGLLTQIVEHIHEDQKTEPTAEFGEIDRVRFWFLKDISRIETVIPWTTQAVRLAAAEEWEDSLGLAKMLTEGQDYAISVLGGAYDFRIKNLELYGLQNERLKNGIVQTNLEGLPAPLTGLKKTVATLEFLVAGTRSAMHKEWSAGNLGPEKAVLQKLNDTHSELVNVTCLSLVEHYQWSLAQKTDKATVELGLEGKEIWMTHREELIFGLAHFEQIGKAIELATRHEVFPTLAELTYTQLASFAQAMNATNVPAEKDGLARQIKEAQAKIDSLYEQFGDRWATAVFEYFAATNKTQQILINPHKEYVTKFLRSRQEFAKIAWINEVKNEKDIPKGAQILLDLGAREPELWNKKVEMSLGKLARLAGGQGYSQAGGLIIPDGGQADIIKTNKQLAIIKIQEEAFDWVFPVISSAIDENAELELAMQIFGNSNALKDTQVLPVVLESLLAALIAHKTLDPISLIDLLTLMGSTDSEQYETSGREFYLALKVLHQGNLSKEEQALNERLIWRRCLIRDEWSEVNNTVLKDDEETAASLAGTALFSTLKACFEDPMFTSPTTFEPLAPSEVLGAGSEPDELGVRFLDKEESAKAALAADMKIEDERLEGFLETCQLEHWWQECINLAKDAVANDIHHKTIEGAEMKKAAEEVKELEAKHFEAVRKQTLKGSRLLVPLHGLRRNGNVGKSLRTEGLRV